MNIRSLFVLIIFVITSINNILLAQILSYESRNSQVIQNINTVDDTEIYNTISNPALGLNNDGFDILLMVKNYYCISNYNSIAGMVNYKFKNDLSINYVVSYKGINDLYRFCNSIGIAKRIFNKTNIGIRLNESKLYNNEYNTKTIISPEIGLHMYLTEKIAFAFSYKDIFSFSNSKNVYSISSGLKYTYSPLLTVLLQTDKESKQSIVYKLGYKGVLTNYLSLYLGVENSENPLNLLLNFTFKNSKYHLGCSYNNHLGISSSLAFEHLF